MTLDGFISYLGKRNIKQSTIRCHLKTVSRILKNCIPFTRESYDGYIASLILSNKRHAYINSTHDTVKLYARYLGLDTFESLKHLKEQTFIKGTMSDEEIEAFLSVPPRKYTVMRHGKQIEMVWKSDYDLYQMFWHIAAFSGMRTGEVAALTVEACDFGRNIFVLSDTKTNEPRLVPIAPNILTMLQAYIKTCTGPYLFPNKKRTGTLDSVEWGYNFAYRIRVLGIKRQNLTPYSLRHSMITRLLEEDVSFPKVMKLAGHKRAETTLKYTHLGTKDVQRAIQQHPLIELSINPEKILTKYENDLSRIRNDARFRYSVQRTNTRLLVDIEVIRYT